MRSFKRDNNSSHRHAGTHTTLIYLSIFSAQKLRICAVDINCNVAAWAERGCIYSLDDIYIYIIPILLIYNIHIHIGYEY